MVPDQGIPPLPADIVSKPKALESDLDRLIAAMVKGRESIVADLCAALLPKIKELAEHRTLEEIGEFELEQSTDPDNLFAYYLRRAWRCLENQPDR
jgi:hypothetical protein